MTQKQKLYLESYIMIIKVGGNKIAYLLSEILKSYCMDMAFKEYSTKLSDHRIIRRNDYLEFAIKERVSQSTDWCFRERNFFVIVPGCF